MNVTSLSNWLIVVPARLSSQRLPNKPLADLGGKPMIVRVMENLQSLQEKGASIVVAADDDAVIAACKKAGFSAVMTKKEHQSGTDRCAEVAAGSSKDYVLNVQGDEPFVDTKDLAGLMQTLEASKNTRMGTLFHKNTNLSMAKDPNVVKVLMNSLGQAIYFSRVALPFVRDDKKNEHLPTTFFQHVGVYAFKRSAIAEFVKLPPSALEASEMLEQLRAIDQGWPILLYPASKASRGIDTKEDLEAARAFYP
jgi:3-deoxy-manno-octulosonate cytidylyltransferase (CMP-KDO synthetase)